MGVLSKIDLSDELLARREALASALEEQLQAGSPPSCPYPPGSPARSTAWTLNASRG